MRVLLFILLVNVIGSTLYLPNLYCAFSDNCLLDASCIRQHLLNNLCFKTEANTSSWIWNGVLNNSITMRVNFKCSTFSRTQITVKSFTLPISIPTNKSLLRLSRGFKISSSSHVAIKSYGRNAQASSIATQQYSCNQVYSSKQFSCSSIHCWRSSSVVALW